MYDPDERELICKFPNYLASSFPRYLAYLRPLHPA
jgi:hypothetical protein